MQVLDQAARTVTARLFNVDTGALVRESCCQVPLEDGEVRLALLLWTLGK